MNLYPILNLYEPLSYIKSVHDLSVPDDDDEPLSYIQIFINFCPIFSIDKPLTYIPIVRKLCQMSNTYQFAKILAQSLNLNFDLIM